jgi:glyoxylase-like metal-dependent hydrolase (beta-lactamase superfamily II)
LSPVIKKPEKNHIDNMILVLSAASVYCHQANPSGARQLLSRGWVMNKAICSVLLIFAVVLGMPPRSGLAEAAAVTGMDYPLSRITDKIYVIYGPFDLPDSRNHGFRNNPVIVLTSAGVVVFDPGGSAWSGELVVNRIKSISQDPVVAVFNSHAHGDHWLGNEGIKRTYPEAVIYGHPVMKARVQGADGDFWLAQIEKLTKGTAGGRRVIAPDKVVNDGDVVIIGDTQFRIHHTGPAHTDSDIMVEIVDQNVLFAGDVVRNGLLGIMESDASFAGNIAAIDTITSRNYSYIIPGHGRAGGNDIALKYRSYLGTVLSTVRELYDEGLADFEMKPAVNEATSAYSNWAGYDIRVGPHVSRAYLEVEAEAF